MFKKKADADNDRFVQRNFEKLIERYPRQCIVICNKEIFTGEDAFEKAKEKYPGLTPMILPIPAPEEFNHLLRNGNSSALGSRRRAVIASDRRERSNLMDCFAAVAPRNDAVTSGS